MTKSDLPENWESKTDPYTKKVYYIGNYLYIQFLFNFNFSDCANLSIFSPFF